MIKLSRSCVILTNMSIKNRKVRNFIVKAFLRIDQDDPEILNIYQDQLFALGGLIKQRSPEIFDEIIRTWTSDWTAQKIKVEINRQRRK